MAVASLILGILAVLISMSIFKDLSLILAILGLVLGGVSFFKKKSKGMCIAGIVLTIISLIIVFSSSSSTQTTSSNGEPQKCKLGDVVTIKASSDSEYTLSITGIKETKNRNEFSDKNPNQVFIIDYTYTCNKAEENIYVSDMNFKIIDEQGEIGETYPVDIKEPQAIMSGITCKAQMAFGVNNKSSKIKLQFFNNMFDSTPTAIYDLDI